jgi:hypothetical protein
MSWRSIGDQFGDRGAGMGFEIEEYFARRSCYTGVSNQLFALAGIFKQPPK